MYDIYIFSCIEPPQPTKNCPRQNGFFPWPAEESCQKFYDCRGGTAYLQICPEGKLAFWY